MTKYMCDKCHQWSDSPKECSNYSCRSKLEGFWLETEPSLRCPSGHSTDVKFRVDSGGSMIYCDSCRKEYPFTP